MQKMIVMLAVLLLACESSDSNYEAIKAKSGPERTSLFRTLPIRERFRIYNKIYKNSGLPHETELASEFRDNPEEAYQYIISDLRDKSSFADLLKYLPILYSIDKTSGFDMCSNGRVKALRDLITSYKLTGPQISAVQPITFHRCRVI